MTGRRRAERRTSTRAHFVVASDDQRSDGDRREFLRRFADLAAELEAATPDRATRLERMAANLAERTEARQLTRTGDGEQVDPWQA